MSYTGLVKVDFSEFREIRPTWGVFFGPIVVRPPNIYRRNERIRISAFQRMSARPKRIRIDEVKIVYMIAQNQKKLKSCQWWRLSSIQPLRMHCKQKECCENDFEKLGSFFFD